MENSKVVLAKTAKQTSSPKFIAQLQTCSQNKTNLSPSSGQVNAQKQTNKLSTNTKPTNDKHTSNRTPSTRQSKGSDDAVKLHNKFGAFEEADDMEFEETPMCPRGHSSRSISPVHHP